MTEILEILHPHAAIISALSAFVSAVAVVISTGVVIWISFFRKTRRDRIDELKTEMQILFPKVGAGGHLVISAADGPDKYFKQLKPKFEKKIQNITPVCF